MVRRVTVIAGVLLGVLALAACADDAPVSTEDLPRPRVSTSPLPDGADIPSFTGPWAGELESAYRASTSDLQRQVLMDGWLTEEEMLAIQDDFRACAEGQGLSEVEFDAEGGFQVTAPEDMESGAVNRSVTQCQAATIADLDVLFRNQRRNPANEDELELMAACLVRQGLVPSDYRAEDLDRDATSGFLPFDTRDVRFNECVSDPTSAGGP